MSRNLKRFSSFACCIAMLHSTVLATVSIAATGEAVSSQIVAPSVTPRSGAEYYSADPDAKVLVRVNVWGEVKEPGVHYVPYGASVSDSVSSAGGPLIDNASLPDIKVVRGNDEKTIDLYKLGVNMKVQRNDTIIVEPSSKRSLSLIFGGASVLISALTLIMVTSNRR